MELNANKIIKALECCQTPSASDCETCSYEGKCLENGEYMGCVNLLVADALTLIKQLTEENERLNTIWAKQCVELEERCMALGAEVADLKDELKCEKETNAHLCGQYMSENHLRHQAEEMLANGMSVVKSDTVREMQTRLAQRIGTYTDKSFVYVSAWFKLIDQIAKEMTGDA